MRLNNPIVLLKLDELEILLRRKQIKHIHLRINAQGQIKISAPMRCPLPIIQQFLLEKRAWILHHRSRQLAKVRPEPTLSSNSIIQFLGKPLTLIIHDHASTQTIRLDSHFLHCSFTKLATHKDKQQAIQQWYHTQMSDLVPDLLEKWETTIRVKVSGWGIKVMKTRWGSCYPQTGQIWLNLHLMYYPLSCLEYIIVHELVHLLEASHNRRFYALMSQFMPDWPVQKKLLATLSNCSATVRE